MSRALSSLIILSFAAFTIAGFTPGKESSQATYTVNAVSDETDDDTDDGICATAAGLCTLRAAIEQANETPGVDMITFALGVGTPTITTAGIEITDPVTIDGATGGATRIELVGTPGSDTGLYIEGGSSTIKHLILNSFGGSGMLLTILPIPVGGPGSIIEDTWIGLDKTGAHKPNGAVDLHVESSGNTIGGTDPSKRNVLASASVLFSGGNLIQNNFIGTDTTGTMPISVGGGGGFTFFSASGNELVENVISGNGGNGVSVLMGSTENIIEGNFIGTNPDGTSAVPNVVDGIHIIGSSDNTIERNIISGNGDDGIELKDGGARTTIIDNKIGTNADGTSGLGNGAHGIRMDAAPENTIGGAVVEERNIISGNGEHGIFVRSEVPEAPFANIIIGNFIGTNAVGTAPIANGGYGVAFEGTPAHFLGGEDSISPPACTGDCNLISGNGMGGIGLLPGASGIFITGNSIGTSADGAAPIPNIGPGIDIKGASTNTMELNRILFNGGPGVRLVESADPMMPANENAIRVNQIFENDGLGIDINGDGVTPNNKIISTGPNKLQAYPVLTSASYDSTTQITTIKGFLQSTENAGFGIEFFENTKPDTTKHGEGEKPVGMIEVTTDAFGRAEFTHMLPDESMNVTATATDEDGNTSEFSRIAGAIVVNDVRDTADADLDDGICDAFSAEEGDQCTLRAAIQTANKSIGDREEIQFGISEEPIIKPLTALPAITDPVDIDGTTQNSNLTCFPDFLAVEIDGSLAGSVDGFTFEVAATGSLIKGLTINKFSGSGIVLKSNDNRIECNFIGTNTTGLEAKGNTTGITISSSNNVVGGASFKESNLISGNANYGIHITTGSGNSIEGNYIGPDKTGDSALSSGSPTGNGWDGIFIADAATGNIIGGATTSQGAPPGNTISNNGVAAPGNDPSTGHGIHIDGSQNEMYGNLIGIAGNQASALENEGHGILIGGSASDNIVGGAGLGNGIANNEKAGVRIESSGAGNTVRGNNIFANGDLGIDLGGPSEEGVTSNDSGDGDSGSNALVNFPVISEMDRDPDTGDVTLEVALDAAFAGDGTVEFFANESCDPTDHGEGALSLGTRTVSSSTSMFDHVLSGLPECRFITTTFTDDAGSTSEFSKCTFNKPECLKITEVQFWHQPPEVAEAVETRKTTDGNPVEIRTLVTNIAKSALDAELHITEDLSNRLILPEPEAHTFAANDVTTIIKPWKTSGYAWEAGQMPQSNREVLVSLTDETNTGTEIVDTMRTKVTIKPRPVVLVHGLWSSAETWSKFKGFFTEIRTDWASGAVGDNRDLAGIKMDTGALPSISGGPFSLSLMNTTTTIADNAGKLEDYIEVIRKEEEAHHIDIVAHSMGGLISRYYIDDIMPDLTEEDDRPIVENLVMLGTPNLGSPCADLYLKLLSQPRKYLTSFAGRIPYVGAIAEELLNQAGEALELKAATNMFQLTPDYVQNTFNRSIHAQRDVPFYIYAGVPWPITCTVLGLGDSVVPLPSAYAVGSPVPGPIFEDSQSSSTLKHTDLPKDRISAFIFAADKIDKTPDDFAATSGKRKTSFEPTDKLAQAEEPQIILAGVVPVLPDGPVSIEISAPPSAVFGVTLIGTNQVGSALYDPSGQLVDSLEATSSTNDLFRTHYKENPEPGTWTVSFEHELAPDTLFIPIIAWVYNSSIRLNLNLGTPDSQGQIPIRATMTEGGIAIAATDMTAGIAPTAGEDTIADIDLFDDGMHGDDAADDATFGSTTPALSPTTYTISVWGTYDGNVRSASQIVDLSDVVNGVGIDLALDMTVSEPLPDTPLVYSMAVSNNGPQSASDVSVVNDLPEGLIYSAATPSQGSCEELDNIVTCSLGTIDVGASVSIDITVTPEKSGLFVNTASVSANESDWNTGNNSVSSQANVPAGTSIDSEDSTLPTRFALKQNYPNPFNPKTTITFDVPQSRHVRLEVFNTMGQRVATLVNGVMAPGRYEQLFDAGRLPSGIYVYRLEAGDYFEMRSMVLLK